MNLKRPLYGPSHDKGPSRGRDVRDFVKRTLHRLPAQMPVGENFFPKPPGGFDDVYNLKTERAVEVFQRLTDITPTGQFGQRTLDEMWPYADAYSRWVYRLWSAPDPAPVVPPLGPIVAEGNSVLLMRLTHETDGIEGFPAFDDGWLAGRHILAPENLTVTDQSGAQGGDAFYALGASGIRYWVGHVLAAPATGKSFGRGTTMAVIANIPTYQGGPHVHLGLNARALGVELMVTGYGPGPTVGDQLSAGLEGDA